MSENKSLTEKEFYEKEGIGIISWYDAEHYGIPLQYCLPLGTMEQAEAIKKKQQIEEDRQKAKKWDDLCEAKAVCNDPEHLHLKEMYVEALGFPNSVRFDEISKSLKVLEEVKKWKHNIDEKIKKAQKGEDHPSDFDHKFRLILRDFLAELLK